MRRKDKLRPESEAWAVLGSAHVVHLAANGAGGPVLRTLHAAILDGRLVFHGAPKGEKVAVMDGPGVVTAERIVAEIPSTWTHPERACPATTFFRSAMVHGTLRTVTDLDRKAAALQALMERFQPQGGYVPITAADPLYTVAVRGVAIWELVPERVVAKAALGLDKPPEWKRRALDGLWDTGQLAALRELSAAWGLSRFEAPVRLGGPEHVEGAVALVRDEYWNTGVCEDALRRAHTGSPAWVVACDGEDVIGTARAISDGAKLAWVLDVAVHVAWRGKGVGAALMRELLDHPAVRGCAGVGLHTRDAGGFYERLGFERHIPPAWRRSYQRR